MQMVYVTQFRGVLRGNQAKTGSLHGAACIRGVSWVSVVEVVTYLLTNK